MHYASTYMRGLLVAICLLALSVSAAKAAVKVEQQINIIDQEFSTASTTDTPTDNSLGLIGFDGSKYAGATVYFEAVIRCDTCSGGNAQASVSLYTAAGSSISSLTSGSSTYTRVTSGGLSLSATNYTIRLKLDATSGTAYVKAARLVILQSGTSLSDTQTQIEVGNNESFAVSTTAVALTDKKLWLYDSSHISSITSAEFTATLWGSSGAYTSYACLFTTGGSEVGCVSVASATVTRPTPVSVSLTSGTTYEVRLKTDSGGTQTVNLANAQVILTQSQTIGIRKFQTYHQHINTLATDNTSTYASQNVLNQFNPANIDGGNKNFYYEATLKTSAGTGYAQGYNVTDTAAVGSSEVTSTSTSYERKRSTDLASTLPVSTKTLDTQIKNSATNTTSVSSSWLISQLVVDPSFTFSVSAVGASTVNNGITTSVASTFTSLPFSNLTFNIPRYAAHKLSVTTNTDAGYTVSAKLLDSLQGNYPGNLIDPFIGNSATWGSPQNWTTPTGSTKNINTGWFGANTTDTRVSGWSSGSEKFGPIETTSHPVMQSSTPDNGTTVYVTYVLGVNILQPADLYSGTLVYSTLPNY